MGRRKRKVPVAICFAAANAGLLIPSKCGGGERPDSFIRMNVSGNLRLMQSDFMGPVNIGSEEMVSINELVRITAKVGTEIHR